jgi:hypothetical protein
MVIGMAVFDSSNGAAAVSTENKPPGTSASTSPAP